MLNNQTVLLEQIDKNLFTTKIKDLFFIPNKRFDDSRGYFREIAVISELDKQLGNKFNITQLNHSNSIKNVIRGFHVGSWNKLVTVTTGTAYCVFIDVRPQSPSYLEVLTLTLGREDTSLYGSLYLPKGLANSFFVIDNPVDYIYAVDKIFKERKENEDMAFSLFDPQFNIQWPVNKETMILSEKDQKAPNYDVIKHLIA